jgi:hypothetical protein
MEIDLAQSAFYMESNLPLLHPEDGASTVLRNVGNDLPDKTVSHPRGLLTKITMKTSYLIRSYLNLCLYRV